MKITNRTKEVSQVVLLVDKGGRRTYHIKTFDVLDIVDDIVELQPTSYERMSLDEHGNEFKSDHFSVNKMKPVEYKIKDMVDRYIRTAPRVNCRTFARQLLGSVKLDKLGDMFTLITFSEITLRSALLQNIDIMYDTSDDISGY